MRQEARLEQEQEEHFRSIVSGLRLGLARTKAADLHGRANLPFAWICTRKCVDGYLQSARKCCSCPRGRSRAKAIACSGAFQAKAEEVKRATATIPKAAPKKWFEKERPAASLGSLLESLMGGK